MISALIIDDDQRCRIDLRRKLMPIEGIIVAGEASSVDEAYQATQELKPNLLLIDVDLSEGTAFDLLERFGTEPLAFFVVLMDASNKYAIKAFKYGASDYLEKPVDQLALQSMVERMQRKLSMGDSIPAMSIREERITLRTATDVHVVPIDQVVRCESKNNATIFYFSNGAEPVQVSKTLKEFEQRLARNGFIRCHQSHLINLAHLSKTRRYPLPVAIMDDGATVPVSMRKLSLLF